MGLAFTYDVEVASSAIGVTSEEQMDNRYDGTEEDYRQNDRNGEFL